MYCALCILCICIRICRNVTVESCVAWAVLFVWKTVLFAFSYILFVYISWHVLHILYLILRWLCYVLIYNFTRYIHTCDLWMLIAMYLYIYCTLWWCRHVQAYTSFNFIICDIAMLAVNDRTCNIHASEVGCYRYLVVLKLNWYNIIQVVKHSNGTYNACRH